MSALYVFICTKTTVDFVVPVTASSQQEFNRKVANAFRGMVGGVLRVGDLKFRSTQAAVANHLLCDGTTIQRTQFPELVDYLGGTTASSAVLPDFSGSLAVAVPTVTQTVEQGGTVNTGGTVTDQGETGGTTGGNVVTGGRIPYWKDPNL